MVRIEILLRFVLKIKNCMQISDNYRIVFDEKNVILQFFEQRQKNKKDGSKENYEYTDDTYHISVKQALKAFLQKNLIGSKSAEDCLSRINEVENKIDSLKIEN